MNLAAFHQLRFDWEYFDIANRDRRSSAGRRAAVASAIAFLVMIPVWRVYSRPHVPPLAPAHSPFVVLPMKQLAANPGAADLLRELEQSTPVVGLEFDGPARELPSFEVRSAEYHRLADAARRGRNELLVLRPQVADLPFRNLTGHENDPKSLATAVRYSVAIRKLQPSADQLSQSSEVSRALMKELSHPDWRRPEAVRWINYRLQIENDQARARLVDYLATISGPESDEALVGRALFDLHPQVRQAAQATLAWRPFAGISPRLSAAFRHPWPAVARHAADTTIKIADAASSHEVDSELIDMLETSATLPDPGRAAKNERGAWLQTEMVRINHLANCLLCHPPAERTRPWNWLVAPAPLPHLPPEAAPSAAPPKQAFEVRGDIVYLRHDFSLVHATGEYAPWPPVERYDYVVRTRPATPDEIARAEAAGAAGKVDDYPQRNEVLRALEHVRSLQSGRPK